MTGIFLKLFHGRDSPKEDMDDWGYDGPTIGPLQYVHTTYATDVKVCFADAETERKFFPDETPCFPDSRQFPINDDCIEFDKKLYGDWSVFDSTLTGNKQ